MLLLAACAAPVPETPPAEAAPVVVVAEPEPAPVVVAARRYLGRPWRFGGRGASLDCMGLVFVAWADANGTRWRDLSVLPTVLVARRQLGAPVPGLDGVPTARIDATLLRSGDVLYLLGPRRNPNEPALVTYAGVPLWVWHMGLYSGGGRFVVGDHHAGEVVETALVPYLRAHADEYLGLFVTRPGT